MKKNNPSVSSDPSDTMLGCPLLPDDEVRDAVIDSLKKENESFRHQLFSAREQCAKWKRRYYEEKTKSYQSYPAYPAYKKEVQNEH